MTQEQENVFLMQSAQSSLDRVQRRITNLEDNTTPCFDYKTDESCLFPPEMVELVRDHYKEIDYLRREALLTILNEKIDNFHRISLHAYEQNLHHIQKTLIGISFNLFKPEIYYIDT